MPKPIPFIRPELPPVGRWKLPIPADHEFRGYVEVFEKPTEATPWRRSHTIVGLMVLIVMLIGFLAKQFQNTASFLVLALLLLEVCWNLWHARFGGRPWFVNLEGEATLLPTPPKGLPEMPTITSEMQVHKSVTMPGKPSILIVELLNGKQQIYAPPAINDDELFATLALVPRRVWKSPTGDEPTLIRVESSASKGEGNFSP